MSNMWTFMQAEPVRSLEKLSQYYALHAHVLYLHPAAQLF